jgi:hypothetical protein
VPVCVNEIIIKDRFPLRVESFPVTVSKKCRIRPFTAGLLSQKIFKGIWQLIH